ncbi:ABC-type transport auxiliary lipoprotein family protein [Aliarcobacter vitoriensis]|uniref:ABC-type transport auxiliary lipoprotein family protein n=1 Tax=Aliarcobacter vitoriensis TaxID=2011099 RepID=UPI003AB0DB07
MRSKILALLLILVFAGCSFKQQRVDINHYSIDFKSSAKVDKAKFNSIFIEDVNVNRSFNLTSIFYNTKPYLFEEYVKNRWVNLPSNMIYNQLTDSFISSNIFENIVLRDKKIEYKYALKTEVIKIYQTFKADKSYAILKIKFDLITDNKILKSYNFDKEILCETNDAYGFVKAVNSGFDEVVNSLLDSLLLI